MDTLDRILNLIKETGISDQEFIRAIGSKNKDLVLFWKIGKSKSYMKYIPEIARYFNVSADYLLCLKEERK